MNISRGKFFLISDAILPDFPLFDSCHGDKNGLLAVKLSLYRYTTKIIEGHRKKLGIILFGATFMFSFLSRLKNVRNLSENYVSVHYQVLGTDRIFFFSTLFLVR